MEFQDSISIKPNKISIDSPQIKFIVENNSHETFQSCRFILFNQRKYSFSPEIFDLYPFTNIVVCINLKIPILPDSNEQSDIVYLKYGKKQKKMTLLMKNKSETTNTDQYKKTKKIGKILHNQTVNKLRYIQQNQQNSKNQQEQAQKYKYRNSHKTAIIREAQQQKIMRLHLKQVKQLKQQILGLAHSKQQLLKINKKLHNEFKDLSLQNKQLMEKVKILQSSGINTVICQKNIQIENLCRQNQYLVLQNCELKQTLYLYEVQQEECLKKYTQIIEQRQKQLKNIQTIYDKKRQLCQKLQKDKNNLSTNLKQVEDILKDQEYQIDSLQQKLRGYQSEKQQLRQLQLKNRQLEVLNSKLSQQNKDLSQTQKQNLHNLNQLNKKLATLQSQLAQQQKNHKQSLQLLNQNNQQLKAENQKLNEFLQQLQKNNRKIQAENQRLKSKSDSLQQQFKQSKQMAERLKQDKHNLQKSMTSNAAMLDKANQQLLNQLNNSQQQVNRLRPQLSQAKKAVNQNTAELKQLKQQLEKLRQEDRKKHQMIRNKELQLGQLTNEIKDKDNVIQEYKKNYEGDIDGKDNKLNIQDLKKQLEDAKHFKQKVNQKMDELGQTLGVPIQKFDSQNNKDQINERNKDAYSIVNFFNSVDKEISENYCDKQKLKNAEKQVSFLKGRLKQLQALRDEFLRKQQEKKLTAEERSILQFMRQQMKKQHKKQHEALKFNEEKYDILKRKIYEEYRSKIIELLNKKDKSKITELQQTLQRFVEGLSNTSHKEAIMAKQVKLKQQARRQVQTLKQKINNLQKNKENTNGANNQSKQPNKLNQDERIERQAEYLDLVKQQALATTYHSENCRLKEQLQVIKQTERKSKEQLHLIEQDIQNKQSEIVALKKKVYQITKQYQEQTQKREAQLKILEQKYIKNQQNETDKQNFKKLNKQINSLNQQLQLKNSIIKNDQKRYSQLQQEYKSMLDRINNRNSKQQSLQKQVARKQNYIKQLNSLNNKLKQQNQGLKESASKLQTDNKKKINQIKALSQQIQNIKSQNKENSQQNCNNPHNPHQQSQYTMLKLQKQTLQKTFKNVLTVIKSIYNRLILIVRKTGSHSTLDNQASILELETLIDKPKLHTIDSLAIDDVFNTMINYIR